MEEALDRAGEFADPLPEHWRSSLDLWRRTEAFGAIHLPETTGRDRPGPPAPGLRRAVPPAAGPGPAPPGPRGDARAIRHDVSARATVARRRSSRRRRLGPRFLARPALRAHQGPAAGPGRDLRRHGRAAPDAPAPPGRRRVGQDGGGRGRPAGRRPGRAPGRVHGADRGAGRAALRGRAARWSTG